jgi:uncharacterized membrane protein YedE/YeeE
MVMMIATLVVGTLIGYMGQRTRFCPVSGIRDYFMIRDSVRLKGLFGIIIGGAIGYTIFGFAGGDIPNFPLGLEDLDSTGLLISAILGGFGLGFFSVFAEGCPFRQHVMVAEGRQGAMYYLIGFYLGIVYFNYVTVKWLGLLLGITG